MSKKIKAEDYIGVQYNYLTILDLIKAPGKAKVLVKCVCGKEKILLLNSLKRGNTKSCGCKKYLPIISHNLSKHPLYRRWKSMNARCNNPNDKSYKNYGAKGVTVCQEWHQDNPKGLQNFIRDMYPTYVEGYELDKDKLAIAGQPKVYSKLSCCWLPITTNNRYRSISKLSVEKVKEIRKRLSTGLEKQGDIAEDYGVSEAIISRINTSKAWKDI